MNRILYFDGAMGTMLQQSGLKAGELPERLNLTDPGLVTDIHRQYIAAGCDILKTNTFGANALKFPDKTDEIVAAAVKNARKAAGDKLVALDIGPTGKLLQPLGELAFEDAYALFAQIARVGQESGADLVLIETMSDTYELKAAVLAAKEHTELPVYATVTLDENGKLLTGGDIAAVVALLEGLGVDALGFNCGLGPKQMKAFLVTLRKLTSLPVILNPNAGLPKVKDGETYFELGPDGFAEAMCEIAQLGVNMLGGCCGTTPAHIARMIEKTMHILPATVKEKDFTVVSSYAKAVVLGERPVVIGERINPTGKKLFKQALRDKNYDYITDEGLAQVDCGAHILDVNVGLPEIDEAEMMAEAVARLQSVAGVPLQIDSADPLVIEKALRLYNGKALVNSVNGKREIMDAVFPLVKKYGGVVVALTLDENGIPETPEGRLAIAEKILSTAKAYGIKKKDLIFDVLTMTVSSDENQAEVTLESLRLIKRTLNAATVLGVSNVSFGLPSREVITSAFLTMALHSGLDAAIINPCAKPVMNAYYSYKALSGKDMQCAEYIASQTSAPDPAPTAPQQKQANLHDVIVSGQRDKAHDLTKELLQSTAPLDIINGYLVPALDVVGSGFEKGTVFLPQLLMSAETAKAAFAAIKAHMESSGAVQEKKGRIILATVKGDVHDIGKNIVKVMLENYGYDVIDLGKNVDIDEVVGSTQRHGAELVGLSALMTTTVASMGDTITALRRSGSSCKIMVGGAVLTEEYAKTIGADYYAKDATGAVAIAKTVFGND